MAEAIKYVQMPLDRLVAEPPRDDGSAIHER